MNIKLSKLRHYKMEVDSKSNTIYSEQTTSPTFVGMGIQQTQAGMVPPHIGMLQTQAGMGMPLQAGAGMLPPHIGMQQTHIGMVPPQIGMQPTHICMPLQAGMGMPPPQVPQPVISSNKRSMGGQYSQKKKLRPDQMEVGSRQQEQKAPRAKPKESFNLKTLNTSATYKKDIEAHLKAYFNMVSNLIEKASTKVTDFYYEGSMLTVSKMEETGPKICEMKGEEDIYKFLNSLCLMRKYNISQFHIQPGIGQGAFVFVKGTMGTTFNPVLHKISMSFQMVRMRKKYYILNQMFDIE